MTNREKMQDTICNRLFWHTAERNEAKVADQENLPFLQFVLIYLMKVIGSIPKMEPVWELLLTDELLMGLCGFNAYQVKNGSCERGAKLRKTPMPEVRGGHFVWIRWPTRS